MSKYNKTNPDDFINGWPIIKQVPGESSVSFARRSSNFNECHSKHPALSKREYFAALAMTTALIDESYLDAVKRAVKAADALIEQLNAEVKK